MSLNLSLTQYFKIIDSDVAAVGLFHNENKSTIEIVFHYYSPRNDKKIVMPYPYVGGLAGEWIGTLENRYFSNAVDFIMSDDKED